MNIDSINLISPLEIKIEWSRSSSEPPLTLSISAILLNKEDFIDKIDDFVFYGSKNNGKKIVSSDRAVTCDMLDFVHGFGIGSSYKMSLDLNQLEKNVNHIRLVVSINLKTPQTENVSFENFSKVEFSLKDSKSFSYIAELNQDVSQKCRCIEVCLVKRYGASWRFAEEKVNRLGGLELSYEDYGEHFLNDTPFAKIGDMSKIEWSYEETVSYTDNYGNKLMNKFKAKVEKIFGSKQPNDDFFSAKENFLGPQMPKDEKNIDSDSFFQEQKSDVNRSSKTDLFFENFESSPITKNRRDKKENFNFGKKEKSKKKECDGDPFFE